MDRRWFVSVLTSMNDPIWSFAHPGKDCGMSCARDAFVREERREDLRDLVVLGGKMEGNSG